MKKEKDTRKVISRRKLSTICYILGVYITQDKDGCVQMWKEKPHINNDWWELGKSSDSIMCISFSYPYTADWEKSLITPISYKGYEK